MKIKTYLPFLAILSLSLSQACTSDELEESPKIPFENSSLEVKVRVESDTGFVNAIGASVRLYDTSADRVDNYEVVYSAATNAEGKCTFTSMAKPEYWISVKAPDGRVQLFNENSPFPTPGHPILLNRLDVVFGK